MSPSDLSGDVVATVRAIFEQRKARIERLRGDVENLFTPQSKPGAHRAEEPEAADEKAPTDKPVEPAFELPKTLRGLTEAREQAISDLMLYTRYAPNEPEYRLRKSPLSVAEEMATYFDAQNVKAQANVAAVTPIRTPVVEAFEQIRRSVNRIAGESYREPRFFWNRGRRAADAVDAIKQLKVSIIFATADLDITLPQEKLTLEQMEQLPPAERAQAEVSHAYLELRELVTALEQKPPATITEVANRVAEIIPSDRSDSRRRTAYDRPDWERKPSAFSEVIDSDTMWGLERKAEGAQRLVDAVRDAQDRLTQTTDAIATLSPVLRDAAVDLWQMESEFWAATGHPWVNRTVPPAGSEIETEWLIRVDPNAAFSRIQTVDFTDEELTSIVTTAQESNGSLPDQLNPWTSGTVDIFVGPTKIGDLIVERARTFPVLI